MKGLETQTCGVEGLMQKELRLTAARIWGKTGCYPSDAESMARLLAEIHDDLTGISAAFGQEIDEVWPPEESETPDA